MSAMPYSPRKRKGKNARIDDGGAEAVEAPPDLDGPGLPRLGLDESLYLALAEAVAFDRDRIITVDVGGVPSAEVLVLALALVPVPLDQIVELVEQVRPVLVVFRKDGVEVDRLGETAAEEDGAGPEPLEELLEDRVLRVDEVEPAVHVLLVTSEKTREDPDGLLRVCGSAFDQTRVTMY